MGLPNGACVGALRAGPAVAGGAVTPARCYNLINGLR